MVEIQKPGRSIHATATKTGKAIISFGYDEAYSPDITLMVDLEDLEEIVNKLKKQS